MGTARTRTRTGTRPTAAEQKQLRTDERVSADLQAEFTTGEEAAAKKAARSFKKYSYRGVELDQLLDLSNEAFIDVSKSQFSAGKRSTGLSHRSHNFSGLPRDSEDSLQAEELGRSGQWQRQGRQGGAGVCNWHQHELRDFCSATAIHCEVSNETFIPTVLCSWHSLT